MPAAYAALAAGVGSLAMGMSGAGGSTYQSAQNNQYTPAQLDYMNWLYPQMQQNYGTAQGIYNENQNFPIMNGPMVQAPNNLNFTGGEMMLNNAGMQTDQFGNVVSSGQGPEGMSTVDQGVGMVGQASQGYGNTYDPTNVTTGSFTDPGTAASYMNPYIENALQPQLQDIQHQLGAQQNTNNSQAAMAGAFGGDRAAIQQGETQRNANDLTNNTIGSAYANAYNTAGNLFNSDQSRGLTAQTQNQNMGLLGYNANASQYNTDQARQLQAGTAMGALGGQQQTMGNTAANSVYGLGSQYQNYGQNVLGSNYQQMINQFQQPYTNFGFLNSALNTTPPSMSMGQTSSVPGPNPYSQIGGTLMSAAGMMAKRGGSVAHLIRGFEGGGDSSSYIPTLAEILAKNQESPNDGWGPIDYTSVVNGTPAKQAVDAYNKDYGTHYTTDPTNNYGYQNVDWTTPQPNTSGNADPAPAAQAPDKDDEDTGKKDQKWSDLSNSIQQGDAAADKASASALHGAPGNSSGQGTHIMVPQYSMAVLPTGHRYGGIASFDMGGSSGSSIASEDQAAASSSAAALSKSNGGYNPGHDNQMYIPNFSTDIDLTGGDSPPEEHRYGGIAGYYYGGTPHYAEGGESLPPNYPDRSNDSFPPVGQYQLPADPHAVSNADSTRSIPTYLGQIYQAMQRTGANGVPQSRGIATYAGR